MTKGASILLVCADAAFRGVLESELARMDFTVSATGSGAEAARMASHVQPDIVLLDLRLFDASWLAVAKQIRILTPAAEVILLAGNGTIDMAVDSVRIVAAAEFPTLRHAERLHIAQALHVSAGRRAHAARLLGISERNLYRKIRAHKLDATSR